MVCPLYLIYQIKYLPLIYKFIYKITPFFSYRRLVQVFAQ